MITSLNAAAVPGPMSNPLAPSGKSIAERREVAGRVDADDVLGQVDRLARRSRLVEQTLARVDLIGLPQRVADRVALRGEEREAHRATDHQRVDDVEQRLDHAELVADLRPAEHGDERPLRLVAQAEQDVDLLLQQQPHRRRQAYCGGPTIEACARCAGAERVVDVGVDARRPASRRTPGRCPPRPDRSAGSPAARHRAPTRRGARGPVSIEYFGFGCALRPAEVAAPSPRCAPRLGEPLDRRQRGADAEVVGDRARRRSAR